MLLKRKAYNNLLSWKNECNGSRAILVEGARRIRKSTIVEEFATNFPQHDIKQCGKYPQYYT